MNYLDKIINYVSPKSAYERMVYRKELERNYTAARTDRYGKWHPRNQPAELTDAPYRNLIKARARDLERNNGIVQGAVGIILRNVVGLGIKPQAVCVSNNGTELWKINDRIEELWAEWINKENCDASRNLNFYQMQEMFLRRKIVDGDSLVIMGYSPNKNSDFPLLLQLIESDLLAEDLIQHEGRYVYGGVEVDDYMAAVAYHLRFDPRNIGQVTRTEASRVIHGFLKLRAPQTRGISALAGIMENVRDCGEFIESELKAARMASALTGVVSSEHPGNTIGRQMTSPTGQKITEIEIGTMLSLAPGEKAEFVTPGRPNGAAAPFVSAILRFVGMGLGLSYEALSRDLSQVNYSSAREGRLQDIKTYEMMQQDLIDNFCQPIYRQWLDSMVLNGKINIPGYWTNKKKFQKCKWVKPGWKWVDPLKEAKGIETQLALNMVTLQDACGQMGYDWQEIVEQRAREEAYIQEVRALNKIQADGGENNSTQQS